ncbi:glycosyltransferase family 2 protein [Microbulbifer sp. YPW1]|uniref:glycosyltransferase n=1 Tax=Microbulbifer sp. YPW1 TaxID=2745199 RepID=UPI001599E013|nr:glycosyltransferase family 2 protein [Microbulbifer sp. YPW1]QKX16590.1 glycosyltransferase [Microbulbifer sp. YPW1]
MSGTASVPKIGIVIIGRNEGPRLRRCLDSLKEYGLQTVYVDSGSTDSSIETAKNAGCTVYELSTSEIFSAGRARNAGFHTLIKKCPQLKYIQFVDGDCILDKNWLMTAETYLDNHPDTAIACGRRREIAPQASVYNMLCDIEWDTAIGDAKECGGDFMIRRELFELVDGFDPEVIAGEEPELCFRLRNKGWKIARLNEEMTIHDAAMYRFGQFAKRSERSGHAYAQAVAMHGQSPEKFQLRQLLSILFWGAGLPLVIMLTAITINAFVLSALLIYPLLYLKITYSNLRHRHMKTGTASMYAFFLVIGKFFQALGALKFMRRYLSSGKYTIIEYK